MRLPLTAVAGDTLSALLYVELTMKKLTDSPEAKLATVTVMGVTPAGACAGVTASVEVAVTVKVVDAVKPVASVTITVLAPAAIVGTVNVAVPAVRVAFLLEDGVMIAPPRVTLKVADWVESEACQRDHCASWTAARSSEYSSYCDRKSCCGI